MRSRCIRSKGNRQVIAEQKPFLPCRFLPQPLRRVPISEGEDPKFASPCLLGTFCKFPETDTPDRHYAGGASDFAALLSNLFWFLVLKGAAIPGWGVALAVWSQLRIAGPGVNRRESVHYCSADLSNLSKTL